MCFRPLVWNHQWDKVLTIQGLPSVVKNVLTTDMDLTNPSLEPLFTF